MNGSSNNQSNIDRNGIQLDELMKQGMALHNQAIFSAIRSILTGFENLFEKLADNSSTAGYARKSGHQH